MISFTKRNVITISIFLTVILYGIFTYYIFAGNKTVTTEENVTEVIEQVTDEITTSEAKQFEYIEDNLEDNAIWNIIIPKINLDAKIAEGTTKYIMDRYVGHFEDTSVLERKYRTCST